MNLLSLINHVRSKIVKYVNWMKKDVMKLTCPNKQQRSWQLHLPPPLYISSCPPSPTPTPLVIFSELWLVSQVLLENENIQQQQQKRISNINGYKTSSTTKSTTSTSSYENLHKIWVQSQPRNGMIGPCLYKLFSTISCTVVV